MDGQAPGEPDVNRPATYVSGDDGAVCAAAVFGEPVAGDDPAVNDDPGRRVL
jgi:hypothetical protein